MIDPYWQYSFLLSLTVHFSSEKLISVSILCIHLKILPPDSSVPGDQQLILSPYVSPLKAQNLKYYALSIRLNYMYIC